MSEYQFVSFRAIDGPVSDKNLQYMERQSSRAEITPWSFDNEYHYGDFHGNALEMLRRGYDIYLHFANFGTRKLLVRFPHGLPDMKSAKPYFAKDGLSFVKDKRGDGGTLSISPYLEIEDLEDLWDLGALMDRLVPLRGELLDGDLRPLYLAHLAVISDSEHDPDEATEGPVPAGLDKLTSAQQALADLYGLSDFLIAVAARESPRGTKRSDQRAEQVEWLHSQPGATKDAWLAELMANPSSAVRAEMLAKFRKDRTIPSWPTVEARRTISQIRAIADEIAQQAKQKAAAKAARQRANRLASMAADPTPYLRETEQRVVERSTAAYREVANQLADLREALAGSDHADLAEKQARKLKQKHPTLNLLTRELRRRHFLVK
jgi:hypothetical protein